VEIRLRGELGAMEERERALVLSSANMNVGKHCFEVCNRWGIYTPLVPAVH
jgi:hypothetical protein